LFFYSAYCGGLWIAALYCTVQMANVLQQDDFSQKYLAILNKAKESYDALLWNGNYFVLLVIKSLDSLFNYIIVFIA